MNLLSKAIYAFMPAAPAGISAAQQTASDLANVLQEFREKRAEDFAQLADRAGRSGERLAEAERDRDQWMAYAEQLERLCLQHGITMPPAPDEGA
ncbi:hypothetical protein ACLBX9_30155 [Methylobacterium sp. A49B]